MIGDAVAVLLLIGGYGVIAVLGTRAVLRDELARRRSLRHVRAVSDAARPGVLDHHR